MNGNSALLDTNVVLYLLSGDASLANYLQPRSIFLSVVSEIEVLGFQQLTVKEEQKIRELLSSFRILGLDEAVKEEAIRLRKLIGLSYLIVSLPPRHFLYNCRL